MSLKNDPAYSLPDTTPTPPRHNSTEGLLALLLGIGIILILLRVPGVNTYLRRLLSHSARPRLDSNTLVWANKYRGVYYCPGSKFYGSGLGTYMKQGNALTAGYQPVLGSYCSQGKQASPEKHGTGAEELNGKGTSASEPNGKVTSQIRQTGTRKDGKIAAE